MPNRGVSCHLCDDVVPSFFKNLPQKEDALPGHASSAGAEDTRARAVPPGLRDLLEAQALLDALS
jgi:hypothetical protein